MEKNAYVHILSSGRYGTLYTGVTSDLIRRVWEHREELVAGFTKEYHVHQLVWYEVHADIVEAIRREKQIKHWKREWRLELIHSMNPHWRDLYAELV